MSYHDAFWVDEKEGWPDIDTDGFIESMKRMLKPGGKLLIVDHNAPAGHRRRDGGQGASPQRGIPRRRPDVPRFVSSRNVHGLRKQGRSARQAGVRRGLTAARRIATCSSTR
jgi:SAM-dependent methyltransferase